MSLLSDIQEAATDPATPVSTLLRRCQILAYRLGNEPFKRWVEYELNGYPDHAELPPYRAPKQGVLKATVVNPARWMRGILVPRSLLPACAKDVGTFRFSDGAPSIEALASSAQSGGASNLKSPMPPELFADLEIIELSTTIEMWAELPVTAVASILEGVRNRALQFALELEAENPSAGETAAEAPVSNERVNQIVTTVVYGGNVAVGAGDGAVTMTNLSVGSGDLEGLLRVLRALGVDEPDLDDLRAALESDANLEARPGPKTRDWLGRMTITAARAAGYVGGGATATVIGTAVARYLGLI